MFGSRKQYNKLVLNVVISKLTKHIELILKADNSKKIGSIEGIQKVRMNIMNFFKLKNVNMKYIDFYLKLAEDYDSSRYKLTPANLYTFVCMHGFYPNYNKKIFEGTNTYKSPVGYLICYGFSPSTYEGTICLNFRKPKENLIRTLMLNGYVF